MSLAQTYIHRLRSSAKELPAPAPITGPVAAAASESSASD
jgi:hypothetical protein